VSLGLFPEGGLKYAGPSGADSRGICQCMILRLPRRILVNSDKRRNAAAFQVLAPDRMSGSLGCDHDDVDILRRPDLVEMDVETVRERKYIAFLQVRF